MKRFAEFLKTTALGGLLVVVPLSVFYLLFDQLLDGVIALAMPIAGLFPADLFNAIETPALVALLLILGASFLFGLALRSEHLTRLGHWIESTLLEKVPLYGPVKRISRGMAGAKEDKTFKVALLESGDGSQELVYVIEEQVDGFATVLVPMAPTGFNGPVKLVPEALLTPIDASLGDASQVLAHWGVGMKQLATRQQQQ
jgi:uncharacterized membrane protein